MQGNPHIFFPVRIYVGKNVPSNSFPQTEKILAKTFPNVHKKAQTFADTCHILKLLQDFCQKMRGLSTMTFALVQIHGLLQQFIDLFEGVLVGPLVGIVAIFASEIVS